MRTLSKLTGFVLLACMSAGCTSTQISNLTPSHQPRNPNNLYAFEAAWHSNQQSIRKDSLQPFVIIGAKAYPMQRTQLTSNRWETLVPIPADESVVNYHFQFDYEYNSVPIRRANSRSSQAFQLKVDPR